MFPFKPDPCSLTYLPGIIDNQRVHQHHPIDRIVGKEVFHSVNITEKLKRLVWNHLVINW